MRLHIWKDVEGNKLTAREFIERWKSGIQKVTALQQLKSSMFGYIFIFVGILLGLFFTFKAKQYWLFIILIGSLIISLAQFLAVYQNYLNIKNIYMVIKND